MLWEKGKQVPAVAGWAGSRDLEVREAEAPGRPRGTRYSGDGVHMRGAVGSAGPARTPGGRKEGAQEGKAWSEKQGHEGRRGQLLETAGRGPEVWEVADPRRLF